MAVSGCGSGGREVASSTRGPRFKSSHGPNFIMNIFTANCWKDENKEEKCHMGMGHYEISVQINRIELRNCGLKLDVWTRFVVPNFSADLSVNNNIIINIVLTKQLRLRLQSEFHWTKTAILFHGRNNVSFTKEFWSPRHPIVQRILFYSGVLSW